jgi:hypothetical protein
MTDNPASGLSEFGIEDEAERIKERWYGMGFREGVFAGKHSTAQASFDEGYKAGVIEGLLSHFPSESTKDWPAVREAIFREISKDQIP